MPDDLVGEDLDHAVHALAPAGHEPVEVGAAHEPELGAQGDGGHDVGAVHDAGVHHDRGVLADLTDHLGQEAEGDGGAVELAPAVVGQQDAVDAEVDEALGVLDGLHALDDDLAGPRWSG